jgi:NADPH-dependent glutamate synthase beta subunit-like oxidoreductase/NAD(P)H-flavin reductase
MKSGDTLSLSFGLQFEDLYTSEGLAKVDVAFQRFLEAGDAALRDRLLAARVDPSTLDRKAESALLIEVAPHLEDFLGELFQIQGEIRELQHQHHELAPLYTVKRNFVQRKALTSIKEADAQQLHAKSLQSELETYMGEPLTELAYAKAVTKWLDDPAGHAHHLDIAAKYAAWAHYTKPGQARHRSGILFKKPHKLEFENLVPVETITVNDTKRFTFGEHEWRHREGFGLTDPGTDLTGALDEANYCIHCHNQGKDSCSTGLREKTGDFKKSPFGVTLNGCPLEEKISEFHSVMVKGYSVAALGIITVDNPLCAGTGHRICNDCMKSCVFQKQEPVNIPQAETRALKEVLNLTWGFEIYSLLTRWNPLNLHRPLPKSDTGYKVLVVGLGPAGYALAHHLMNDGHTVCAVDGLKIEPLPEHLSGVDAYGNRRPFRAIREIHEIYESLDDRVMAGFGGVAEYGITVRWDKNFLKVIRLLLERRRQFAMFGGVRFGGAMTVDSAFAMGFDHIALCAGAGRPTVIPMKNGLARGVRQASDFLMALQLTGAARTNSIANLQLRLPAVVIGGGLTAVDTATESLAYYPVQVRKFLERYEALCAANGEAAVRAIWNEEENLIADEFLAHARAIRAEDEAAAREGRNPVYLRLLQSWGGVTLAYRRRMIDSPSYTLNHEEVAKALEEGIHFAECLSPEEVGVDRFGHAVSITMSKLAWDAEKQKLASTGEMVTLPAKSILVAAGTQPNTVLEREDATNFILDGKYFQALDENGDPVKPERVAKPNETRVLTSLRKDGKAISFFGDLHPSFSGNVVKAMGSAKQGYPVVSRILAARRKPEGITGPALVEQLNVDLRAVVADVIRLTPTIVEIVVKAPLAARAFHPGQFYRLQNFETLAPRTPETVLAMEGLALTGASVDREAGTLSTIVLEMGGSSDLCSLLKKGEPVVLMGPTGTPTETPAKETVLLVGGGLGNAVLFSIGQTLRANGSRVIYFAGYKKAIDRYKIEEIERAADTIVWCCDEAPGFTPTRAQDRAFVGNIVAAMEAYGKGALHGEFDDSAPKLQDVDRVIAIGSDGMMAAVARARHTVLAPYLTKRPPGIGSINSPMQCMMKEICAQCLQMHRDPETGKETVVFSCFNQDQSLDHVDWGSLRQRLSQNSTQEKLTKLWIDRCLKQLGMRPELTPAS